MTRRSGGYNASFRGLRRNEERPLNPPLDPPTRAGGERKVIRKKLKSVAVSIGYKGKGRDAPVGKTGEEKEALRILSQRKRETECTAENDAAALSSRAVVDEG